jgi:hypothetical protein
MDISAIALQGLQQADAQLEKAATRIASAGTDSTDGASLDVVDLTVEMVALLSSKNAFSANLSSLKAADDVQKTALDLLA